MCIDCWKKLGSPMIINDKTKKAAKAINKIYDFHGAGGSLHIIIDDWNLEDSHIDFCDSYIDEEGGEASKRQKQAERYCLRLLKDMTIDERASALYISKYRLKP